MSIKALTVFRKELADSWRDRRSLTSALTFSLFGPLFTALALSLVLKPDDRTVELAVAGADRAPSLVRFLEQNDVEVRPAPADPRAAVRQRDLELALVIPESYAADFRQSQPARVELVYDASRTRRRAAVRRVQTLLESYGRQVANVRLIARGVSPQVAQPVQVDRVDLSTAASRAAFAMASLPIFLLMAAFVGGMNVAIDTTAGERERGSLESLLVHPVPRGALATGKWMSATAFNLLGVVLTLGLMVAVLRSDRMQRLDVPAGMGTREALMVLAVLVPLALLAPALQMLISIFSRSFKEAQTYLSLLLLVPMLPGFVLTLGQTETRPWMDALPLLGQQILVLKILRGEATDPLMHVLLAAVTLAATAVSIAVIARLLHNERIVLGR